MIEGEHELPVQHLVEWVLTHEHPQLAY